MQHVFCSFLQFAAAFRTIEIKHASAIHTCASWSDLVAAKKSRDYRMTWNQLEVRRDSMSFLYTFLRPEAYWWMIYTLIKRIAIVFFYLLGQSNNPYKRGFISFQSNLQEITSLQSINDAAVESSGAAEMDWLTLVSLLLAFDIYLQVRVDPYLRDGDNIVEVLATALLLVQTVVFVGISNELMLMLLVSPVTLIFLGTWFYAYILKAVRLIHASCLYTSPRSRLRLRLPMISSKSCFRAYSSVQYALITLAGIGRESGTPLGPRENGISSSAGNGACILLCVQRHGYCLRRTRGVAWRERAFKFG